MEECPVLTRDHGKHLSLYVSALCNDLVTYMSGNIDGILHERCRIRENKLIDLLEYISLFLTAIVIGDT